MCCCGGLAADACPAALGRGAPVSATGVRRFVGSATGFPPLASFSRALPQPDTRLPRGCLRGRLL